MEESKSLEIREILKILRKRILIVLSIPIIFSIIGGTLKYYSYEPVYEARVSLIAGLNENYKINPSEIFLYQSIINTFIQIARSSVVAEEAVQKLNDGTSAQELQGGINIVSQADTQILIMSFRSNDPKDALKKVEIMSQTFIEQSNRMLTNGKLQIMDGAKTSLSPINSRSLRDFAIPFLVGLVISVGISLFIEIFNNTIKDEKDVEKYLGIPVMGIIPKH
jgi:succinoglycan biosynthesis transport protein ExoP